MGPSRERRWSVASIVVTVAMLLAVVGAVVVGGATATPALAMASGGHWVYNAASRTAQHVDGGTTAVDAQVAVDAAGPVLMTLQGDRGGFVVAAGDVTAFSKSDLTVAGNLGLSSPERPFGIETLGGPYLAYGTTGTIVRLGLQPETIEVGGPFAAPVITTDGTLWLRRTDNSAVCSLGATALQVNCTDSAPGNGTLTVLTGKPAWVSIDADTVRFVEPGGGNPVPLGVDLAVGTLIADRDLDGVLAALDPRVAGLAFLDLHGVADGRPGKLAASTIALPPGDYEAPMATDGAIAVLDHTSHQLRTFTPAGIAVATQTVPDDAQTLMRGQDGRLYLDDANGDRTHVVAPGGGITSVGIGPPTNIALAAPPQQSLPVPPKMYSSPRIPSGGGGPPDGNGPPTIGPLPPEQPGQPGNLAVTAGDAQAVATWTASAPAAATYELAWTPGGGTATVNATNLTFTITGLTNGTTYTLTVTAVNDKGRSAPVLSAPFTPGGGVPDAPSAPIATRAAQGGIALTWGVVDGKGHPITEYAVTATDASGATARVATSTTTAATISTGLTLGNQYTFTVIATNERGPGLPSAPSNAITPWTDPGAPTNLTATGGPSRIELSWSPPASLGGGRGPAAYEVSSPGLPTQRTSATTFTYAVSPGVPTDGVTYQISVRTIVGKPANEGPTATPLFSEPATVPATPGEPPAMLIWNAGLSGDRTIAVEFEVEDNSSGPVTCTLLFNGTALYSRANCPEGRTTAVISGLEYATTYSISPVPRNSFGQGPTGGALIKSVRTNDAPAAAPPQAGPPAPAGPSAPAGLSTPAAPPSTPARPSTPASSPPSSPPRPRSPATSPPGPSTTPGSPVSKGGATPR